MEMPVNDAIKLAIHASQSPGWSGKEEKQTSHVQNYRTQKGIPTKNVPPFRLTCYMPALCLSIYYFSVRWLTYAANGASHFFLSSALTFYSTLGIVYRYSTFSYRYSAPLFFFYWYGMVLTIVPTDIREFYLLSTKIYVDST
jgi:hypothetical protein